MGEVIDHMDLITLQAHIVRLEEAAARVEHHEPDCAALTGGDCYCVVSDLREVLSVGMSALIMAT